MNVNEQNNQESSDPKSNKLSGKGCASGGQDISSTNKGRKIRMITTLSNSQDNKFSLNQALLVGTDDEHHRAQLLQILKKYRHKRGTEDSIESPCTCDSKELLPTKKQ